MDWLSLVFNILVGAVQCLLASCSNIIQLIKKELFYVVKSKQYGNKDAALTCCYHLLHWFFCFPYHYLSDCPHNNELSECDWLFLNFRLHSFLLFVAYLILNMSTLKCIIKIKCILSWIQNETCQFWWIASDNLEFELFNDPFCRCSFIKSSVALLTVIHIEFFIETWNHRICW